MEAFLSQPFQPFSIAATVLAGLILIEVVSLLFGFSVSGGLEDLAGIKALEHVEFIDSGLGWLNVGRVPFLALFIMMLALFAAFGFVIQSFAISVYGPLPRFVAVLLSFGMTIPITRSFSRVLAKIIPRDETYATAGDHFVGRTGIVSLGPVKTGVVARIKIQDEWKNWHFPRAIPAFPEEEIDEGETVLVVDTKGNELLVTKADSLLQS